MELLAPAGAFDTALAAFAAGADAVYLGLDVFSARAEASNFSVDQLADLLAIARRDGKCVYVTFNTLVDECRLGEAAEKLAALEELGPDGVIVQDLGVARMVARNFPALKLHASTQMAVHNLEGALALKELGFTRVVPARELSLDEVRVLVQRSGLEVEVFVHGALCYSLSGLCLFSAMELGRSGNRGRCAYCCRSPYIDAAGGKSYPFSMRDLRLDDHLEELRAAGVASLKIEGRMKNALYVSTVVAHYRALLDGTPETVSREDMETVFSRRTTSLYVDGAPPPAAQDVRTGSEAVIDPVSLGHLGTPIGTVKRITRDREGRSWLRFHTSRALERHDGLQFPATGGGKSAGFGISEMRLAISRRPVFEAPAGSDVEILVQGADESLQPGTTIYCSASNAVRRRFPVPSFRPGEVPGGRPIAIAVKLRADGVEAVAESSTLPPVTIFHSFAAEPSAHPEKTAAAVERAFARLGGTGWLAASVKTDDPDSLSIPASVLNEARRELVERLDAVRADEIARRAAAAADSASDAAPAPMPPERVLRMRVDQSPSANLADYDEVVVAIGRLAGAAAETALLALADTLRSALGDRGERAMPSLRVAMPPFTHEEEFARLRSTVKRLAAAGCSKWEAADLATLRMLRELGFADITADWSLYGFNHHALDALAALGVTRVVASPENNAENLAFLAARTATPTVECLARQSTPLFLSLTRPATDDPSMLESPKGERFRCQPIQGLWTTTRATPTKFSVPDNSATIRDDISYDVPPGPCH